MLTDLYIQSLAKRYGIDNINIRYGDININTSTKSAEKNIGNSIAIITGINIVVEHTIGTAPSFSDFQAVIASHLESNSVIHFKFSWADYNYTAIPSPTGAFAINADANCIVPAKGIIKLDLVIPSVFTLARATAQFITIN